MSSSLRIALSICEEISVKYFSTNITGIVLAPKIGVGFSCALKKKKKKRKKEIFRVPSGGGVALVIHMQQWYRIFSVVSVRLRKVNNTLEGFSFFFFSKHFYRDEPFHWTSHRKYRFFYTNGKRSLIFFLFLQNVVLKPTWMVSAKNLIHFTTCGIILK